MGMNTCDGHDDFVVVFEATKRIVACPVCRLEDDLSDRQTEINELNEKVSSLDAELDEVTGELENVKKELNNV